ncbi:hypothetical protein CPB85DRAFT_1340639 [Mucidula mucida]|nr:hypothetical protein CPB85DRAFT_1340639 [Mucidula mucida]
MAHEFVTDCAITQFGIPLSSTVHRRNATTGYISSPPRRRQHIHTSTTHCHPFLTSLITMTLTFMPHLAASNKSLDGIMTALLAFIPDLNQLEEILLAIEAVGQFFTPAPSTLEPMLVDNMPQIAPVLFPCILKALRISVLCLPTAGGVRPVDMPVVFALKNLLHHQSGRRHFAESDSLTVDIDTIIQLWISFSSATTCHPAAPDLVNVIATLYTYVPTREALVHVVGKMKRSSFCQGLLTTNMCGLGVLGRACPSLRRLFFHQGALEALCGILRRFVIQDTRAGLDHSAYFHVHAVCCELYGLLRCEVSSSYALERALKCGLLDIIVYAVSIFGQYPARTCGTMPSILQYISDWCLRSRRIAIRVHGLLTALRSNTELWESLPKLLQSQNGLTVAFHGFLDKIESMVVLPSPEREKLIIPCMNSKCDDKVCESKRYKRCAKCKAFVVCSRACFKAAYKAGEHTRADCNKSLDELDAPML